MIRVFAVFAFFVKFVTNPTEHSRIVEVGTGLRADAGLPPRPRETFLTRLALPFRSNRLCRPPSLTDREAVERANAQIMAFLLQGVDLEAMPRAADERLAEALAPLRKKLDAIIDMLARLSYRDVMLPPVCEIELGSVRIAWHSAERLQDGEWLRIELYFHPTFREPVVVYAAVTGCVVGDAGESFRIEAELIEMSDEAAEALARLALLSQRQRGARRAVRSAAARTV